MKRPIPIRLAVEDGLSEWVVRRILAEHGDRFAIGPVYGRSGFGYLKKQSTAFNHAARACPFLLLTDLDDCACPPALLAEWLADERHPHFLLRVAVREVESWLLGDAVGLGRFLRLRAVPNVADPEALADPKHELLSQAMKSPSRTLREAIVWRDGETGRLHQGPDYNGALCRFVEHVWRLDVAQRLCPSLRACRRAVSKLESAYVAGSGT